MSGLCDFARVLLTLLLKDFIKIVRYEKEATAMPTRAAQLRALLAAPDMVVAPGAYDAITARLIEQAGFPAAYMTGAGTSAARGFPDYGLLTLTEMAENAGILARAIAVPLVAD